MAAASCKECDDGESCGRAVRDCPVQRQSAIEAGIPESVIDGKTKLRDHFSREYINAQAGRQDEDRD